MDDELDGPDIRIMPEYGCSMPLWDNRGGLDGHDYAWLEEKLGFSPDLLGALEAWGEEWNDLRRGDPSEDPTVADLIIQAGPGARHEAHGRALYERALTELRPGLTLEYRYL
ncbi:MAG: hypothetical protein ACJ72E_13270 [Marmoricola sp.]